MGGTRRESFVSPLGWVHPQDGCFDVAVGEEDNDNAGPHNTANKSEHHNLIDGCIWGGEG